MLKEKWSYIQLLYHSGCLIAGSGFATRGNLNSQKYCLNIWKFHGSGTVEAWLGEFLSITLLACEMSVVVQ